MKQCRMRRFATLGVLYGCDTLAVCRACECKISEMVEFLNSDREHMQQGIFPDVQQSYLLHSALNFDEVNLCVSYFICTPYPPGINTGIWGGGGRQGYVQFVYAMMSLHTIYWEKSVVYTEINRRLSFDFECQSHNHCLLSHIWGGGVPVHLPPPPVLIPALSQGSTIFLGWAITIFFINSKIP